MIGMPVGPITLSDEVGIDISNHVGSFMSKADLGVRMAGGDPRQAMQYVAVNCVFAFLEFAIFICYNYKYQQL